MKLFYLSFAAPDRFLGGCLCEAEEAIGAVMRAHRLGINPGGEVAFVEVPNDRRPDRIYHDRLLQVEEIRRFWPDAKALKDME